MDVNNEYFKRHKENKTIMKAFVRSGDKSTMLGGKITAYDEASFVLDDCLIQINKLISITPNKD